MQYDIIQWFHCFNTAVISTFIKSGYKIIGLVSAQALVQTDANYCQIKAICDIVTWSLNVSSVDGQWGPSHNIMSDLLAIYLVIPTPTTDMQYITVSTPQWRLQKMTFQTELNFDLWPLTSPFYDNQRPDTTKRWQRVTHRLGCFKNYVCYSSLATVNTRELSLNFDSLQYCCLAKQPCSPKADIVENVA